MTAPVETVWLFVRGSESVRMIRAATPDGSTRLLVYGPGNAEAAHDFLNEITCAGRQAEIERELVANGFALERFTDRRNGSDRRSVLRGADRRGP